MTGLYTHAGLKISSTKLQLVEIFGDVNGVQLENLNEVVFAEPIDFKSDRTTKILAQLQSAYDEIRIRKSVKSSTLSFALPLDLFYIVQIPIDNTLLSEDMLAELRWEFSVLYPFLDMNEISVQYYEVEKNSFITYNTAMVYGLDRKYIQILESFCKKNNVNLGFIDNAHLASERALKASNSYVKDGLRLSVYISKNRLSILYLLDGKLIYQRVIETANADDYGKLIRNELASARSIMIKRELIKAAYATSDLIIDNYIGKINFHTGLNFIVYNPFDKIIPVSNLKNSPLFLQRYNTFSSAAGIAYRVE